MTFELILVDAETQDLSTQRLAQNSQLLSCPRWARDSIPALRERRFGHLNRRMDPERKLVNRVVRRIEVSLLIARGMNFAHPQASSEEGKT